MKKVLCLLFSIILLVAFCGCQNATDNSSESDAEIIIEEIVETQGDNNSGSQNVTSNVVGDVSNMDNSNDSTANNNDNTVDNSTADASGRKNVSTSQPSDVVDDSNVYKLNDTAVLKNIKLNGRCEKSSNGIVLGMAASAIEFNTDSTAVMLEADCAQGVYYSVVVDGQTVQDREVTTSGTNYIFVRGLSNGTHNIKIIRDVEGRTDMYFTAVSLQLDDGKLLTKDADKKVIEFLGDSLTSGYGNLVVDGTPNPQELKNQSALLAYPYLISNKLGFDYRIVSQSGIALAKRDGYLAFPDYYNLENYHLDKEKKYTSSNPQDVDIVVVNLGTNDIGSGLYDNNSRDGANAYIKHYADLITNIGYRKDAKIIFVSGVWYKDPAIADGGVEKELKSRGYNNVYTLSFVKQYKSGGGGHPSKAEHQEIADTIIKFFKDKGIA